MGVWTGSNTSYWHGVWVVRFNAGVSGAPATDCLLTSNGLRASLGEIQRHYWML